MKSRTTSAHETRNGDYMNAHDVYMYFGKRVALERCIELLHKGHIRSARIGGKLLTKREYLREFEETIFFRATAPTSPHAQASTLSSLVVSHKGIEERTQKALGKTARYRPLKPR